MSRQSILQTSSIWITTGDATEQGGLRTDTGEALFEFDDINGDLLARVSANDHFNW